MAYNTHQSEDAKSIRRQAFLRRMNAKLRMKEAMQDHGSRTVHRFSDFR